LPANLSLSKPFRYASTDGCLGIIRPTPSELPGDPGNETTLNHVLDVKGVIPNRTIAEMMDIRKMPLCYEYIEPS
jgi:hypothetical protein